MPQHQKITTESSRRSFHRLRLGIAARLETLHGRKNVRLVDLSQGGAQVVVPMVDFTIREGVLMWLNFEIFSKVVWYDDDRIGLLFERPLPIKALVLMRDVAPSIIREESLSDELAARAFVDGSAHIGADR